MWERSGRGARCTGVVQGPAEVSSFCRPSLFASVRLLGGKSSDSCPSLHVACPYYPDHFGLLGTMLKRSVPAPHEGKELSKIPVYVIGPVGAFLSILLGILRGHSWSVSYA